MIYLTILAGLQLLVIVGLIYLRDRERQANTHVLTNFAMQAERERLELINHIKAPHYLTPPPGPVRQPRSEPHPNLAKIGTFAPRESEAS